jgi:hypothetical protein
MKKIVTLFSLFIMFYCKAQSTMIPLYTPTTHIGDIADAYYKDTNNLQNQFVGTWKYTNGTTTFKIVLSKLNSHYNGKYYEDIIVGEYEYYENGVLKISTLSNLLLPQTSIIENIRGYLMCPGSFDNPLCADCSYTDRKVTKLDFNDPQRQLMGTLYLRRVDNGTQQILNASLFQDMVVSEPNDPRTIFSLTVPALNYTLIKE